MAECGYGLDVIDLTVGQVPGVERLSGTLGSRVVTR